MQRFRSLLFVLLLCICLCVPGLVASAETSYNFIPFSVEVFEQVDVLVANGYFTSYSDTLYHVSVDIDESFYKQIDRFRFRDSDGQSLTVDSDVYINVDISASYLSTTWNSLNSVKIYLWNSSGTCLYNGTISNKYYSYDPNSTNTGYSFSLNDLPVTLLAGTYTIGIYLIGSSILVSETVSDSSPLYYTSSAITFATEDIDTQILADAIQQASDDIVSAVDSAADQAHQDSEAEQEAISSAADQAHQDAEEQKGLLSSIISGVSDVLSAIVSLPQTLIDLLIDALTYLFVPSDDFFSDTLTDLQEFLQEHLGILYLPVDIIDRLVDLLTISPSNFELTLPELTIMDFTFMKVTKVIISFGGASFYVYYGGKQVVALVSNDLVSSIVAAVRLFGDLALTAGLIKYIYSVGRKWGITDSSEGAE